MTPITTPLKSTKIDEIVQEWYADFVDIDQIMLFELVTAANFMDIKALLDLTCLAVSVLIKVSACMCGAEREELLEMTLYFSTPYFIYFSPYVNNIICVFPPTTSFPTQTKQGKSAEEIRRIFNISNNFSGEEDEIRNNTENMAPQAGSS